MEFLMVMLYLWGMGAVGQKESPWDLILCLVIIGLLLLGILTVLGLSIATIIWLYHHVRWI